MTGEQVVNGIEAILKEHVSEMRVSMQQGDYKRDIFRLFAQSYATVRLHGDQISADLAERGINDGTPEFTFLVDLREMWNEWTYAWDNYPK